MTLSVAHITFDCRDAVALSRFWSEALGRPVDEGAQPFFASIGFGAPGPEPAWLFLQVPEDKAAKNRMHLDLTSDDRAGEVERLVAIGARHIGDHDEWGHQWSVLNDPEGNEFCVASR